MLGDGRPENRHALQFGVFWMFWVKILMFQGENSAKTPLGTSKIFPLAPIPPRITKFSKNLKKGGKCAKNAGKCGKMRNFGKMEKCAKMCVSLKCTPEEKEMCMKHHEGK